MRSFRGRCGYFLRKVKALALYPLSILDIDCDAEDKPTTWPLSCSPGSAMVKLGAIVSHEACAGKAL
jgi:hypothetical protein